MHAVILTLGGLGLAVLGATPALADRTFADADFPTAGWGIESRLTGALGSAAASQQATGNPGSARRITINLGAAPSQVQTLSRFGTSQATRYDPAVDGAIQSISFTIDHRQVSGLGTTVIPAAKQGSFVYIAQAFSAAPGGSWQTLSITSLSASDFVRWDAPGTIDFSATAEPIRFGFVSSASATDASPAQMVTDFDNFQVVARVPTPGTALALTCAGLVGAFRRRRAPLAPRAIAG